MALSGWKRRRPPPPKELASLNDILTAWRDVAITYRRAMALSGIDSLFGLYEAARLSAVPIRKRLSFRERQMAERASRVLLENLDADG